MSAWHTIELHGRSLIEASAGTGKTWTISALYLRLLLQTDYRPQQILVATFSEAAADELRERIRSVIEDAVEQLRPGGRPSPGSALLTLLGGDESAAATEYTRLRLQLAAQELDLAPIGTLHSLCKRILSEHALDTGSPINWTQLLDERALHEDVCLDLWRGLIHGQLCQPLQRRQLIADGLRRLQQALRLLTQLDSEPMIPSDDKLAECQILSETRWAQPLRQLADIDGVFARPNSAIRGELRDLADLLQSDDGLPKNAASGFPNLSTGRLDAEPLSKQLRANAQSLLQRDPAFQFALRAVAVLQHAALSLRGSALATLLPHYRQRRAAALQRSEGFTYQLLIDRVQQALRPSAGEAGLADTLYQRWPVAMVDEFQDTDAKQYAILDRLYRNETGQSRGTLIMIGDPKQAIYGFRGGDLLTYYAAADSAQQQLSLTVNHRASAAYVTALNSLYQAAGDGFAMSALRYQPVSASPRRADRPYEQHGSPLLSPLKLHVLDADKMPNTLAERNAWALASAAEQIATLLNDPAQTVAGKPLHAGQFAVLLPTNEQVAAMREHLRRRGVPCAGAGRSDVFATAWAEAIQLLLWAWLHPGDGGALRASLMSPLFGLQFADLLALEQQPDALAQHAEQFAAQARSWQRNGVLSALIPLIEQQAARLLDQPERGERALTDLRHLGELLAEAESEGRHGEALWRWLSDQRDALDEEPGEERQLRVESDRQRVKLMTLHASKGLEFDFVILPLLFSQTGRAVDLPRVFDQGSAELRIDLGSDHYTRSCAEAAAENQRERLRVLYVALTRAVYRCDLWLLEPTQDQSKRSPGDPQRAAVDRLLEPLLSQKPWPTLSGIEWCPASPTPGMTGLLDRSEATPIEARPREPLPTPRALRRQVSFSSLAHAGPGETRRAEDEPELDDAAAGEAEPNATLLSWASLRGSQFGNALHGMLENRRLDQAFSQQAELICDQLRAFGLAHVAQTPQWVERIGQRLDRILNTPIRPGLCLLDLDAGQQQPELDFRLTLSRLSLGRLREVCERYGDTRMLPLHWRDEQLRGLLVGKIDLVFLHEDALHVLDYKSNFLGLSLRDYAAPALQRAMDHSAYRFQALLYSVAVHRYLRQRRPDYEPQRHLGEACYLFLRAVGLSPADPELGLWRHRFDQRLIDAVDAVLADQDEADAA
ncbi:UvrD-helicase domain-containing protein [Pseudomarimonas arenosa]|uniref:RecBCD enzyme subunit RecB n=1 Tax=Pseudomarimonas arenosa TaxID=2774145 RepID=A0AAW3ZH21_9GAMM|nr:UvrD-helicase domain-containing protein [Pseudomarimonas arenosa]MBD8524260.1 UvrD-helicase domain-containing protein [Pseudomarimonas arenosa]